MNILFLVQNPVEANAFYRSTGIAKDLEKHGNFKITIANWQELTMNWSVILQYDVIMFQRPFTEASLTLCRYIKECGVKLWLDYDDDLLNVSPENKYYINYNKPDTKECIKKILALADAVTVTTVQIRDSFLCATDKIAVIPNAFNDGVFKREKRKREKTVFWRGTDSHVFNLMAYGREMTQAIETFADWRFAFMGFYPWMLPERKSYVNGMDIIIYYNTIQKLAPSVFHAPLVCDAFNTARSPVSFIEGTFAGACCIVPHWWPVEGALKYQTNTEYYENLRGVCSGEVDVDKFNRISWEFIQDVYALSKVNVQRKELLESLCK